MIPHDVRKTMQLVERISLSLEISVNVNVADGLANGADCVLQKIHLTSADNKQCSLSRCHLDEIR